MNQKHEKIDRLFSLQDEVRELKHKISLHKGEVTTLQQEVTQIIQEAADRLLVDEQGQHIDGAVYWFRYHVLVRLNGTVKVLPCQTMDEEKVFNCHESEDEEEPLLEAA